MASHVKAGRLKALAVTSAKRVSGWDVPTIAEAGLKGYEMPFDKPRTGLSKGERVIRGGVS